MADEEQVKPPPPPRAELFLTFESSWQERLACALALLTVLGLLRIEALLRITTHYLGGFQGDAGLYSWLMNVNARDLFRLPWFDTNAFYPYGYSLAWSDNFILPSLIALGLSKLGLAQPLIFNLIVLAANFLNGFVTSRLYFKLTGEALNAFSAGAAFMALGFFTFNLGHPQLQFFFWIPLAFLALIAFLNSPGLLRAIPLGLVLFCCFLTTVYYAVFAAILIASVLFAVVLLRPRHLKPREYAALAAGTLVGLAPVLPFLPPYLEVRETFGARNIYEAYYFSASALSFLSAAPHNFLYAVTSRLSHPEAHFFAGFTLLIFSVLALRRLGDAVKLKPWLNTFITLVLGLFALSLIEPSVLSRFFSALLLWACLGVFARLIYLLGTLERKLGFVTFTARDLIALFGMVALCFFILSFGPQGNPEKGHPALAPYRLLYEIFPGFDSIRAISRAGSVYLFALTLLFALELSHLATKRPLGMALLLPVFFIFAENYLTTYPLEEETPQPPVFGELARSALPAESVIVLPFAGELDSDSEVKSWSEFARLNVSYLHWLFPYDLTAVNGYSGQRTKLMRELPRELKDFPSGRAVTALNTIGGLKYIVYLSQFDKKFNASEFNRKFPEVSSVLKILSQDDLGGYVFELNTEQPAHEDLAIWLPSRAGSSVVFEARSAEKTSDARVIVELYMKDDYDLVLAGSFELTPDRAWKPQDLPLPPARNHVRPVQLSFQPKNNAKIFVRNVRLKGAVNH